MSPSTSKPDDRSARVRYDVEVHSLPPFKWKLKFVDGTKSPTGLGDVGEADSFETALADATAKAHEYELDRRWKNSVQTVTVLSVDPSDPISPLAHDLEAYLEAESSRAT